MPTIMDGCLVGLGGAVSAMLKISEPSGGPARPAPRRSVVGGHEHAAQRGGCRRQGSVVRVPGPVQRSSAPLKKALQVRAFSSETRAQWVRQGRVYRPGRDPIFVKIE